MAVATTTAISILRGYWNYSTQAELFVQLNIDSRVLVVYMPHVPHAELRGELFAALLVFAESDVYALEWLQMMSFLATEKSVRN